jgi:hypothetical protein
MATFEGFLSPSDGSYNSFLIQSNISVTQPKSLQGFVKDGVFSADVDTEAIVSIV